MDNELLIRKVKLHFGIKSTFKDFKLSTNIQSIKNVVSFLFIFQL